MQWSVKLFLDYVNAYILFAYYSEVHNFQEHRTFLYF